MPTTAISQNIFLVSSCLVGLCTRYDGCQKTNKTCINRLKKAIWIPVCPEQLGGLPTPREAADIIGGDGKQVLSGQARVMTRDKNTDITAEFIRGAWQVLKIAQSQNIKSAFLKSKSPSCGVTGTVGVTAALLQAHGIDVQEL